MMKKIVLFLLLTQVCYAYPIQQPFPPFRIIGNVYYVGTNDLASYLIVTAKGNILINSNLEVDVPKIKNSIEKLGFKYSDTKILLVSHGHIDHAGGSALIKQQTHAKYMVMNADVPLITSGGKSDFQYSSDSEFYFPKTTVDKILHDGDKISLGGTTLTAYLTAGHTQGCTSWALQVNDHCKKYNVVIVGSLHVNTGYKLINNDKYPNIAKDFEHAFQTLKSLPCDIFLGAHAGYFNLAHKYALLQKARVNPFVDPMGYKQHIAMAEAAFYKDLCTTLRCQTGPSAWGQTRPSARGQTP